MPPTPPHPNDMDLLPALTTRMPAAVLTALTQVLTDKLGPSNRDEILGALDMALTNMEILVMEELAPGPGQDPGYVLVDYRGDEDNLRQVSNRVYRYRPVADAAARDAQAILEQSPDLTPAELDQALENGQP